MDAWTVLVVAIVIGISMVWVALLFRFISLWIAEDIK